MFLTEEEAKQKWCPFKPDHAGVRAELGYPTTPLHERHHCLGSACMAWRAVEEFTHTRDGVEPKGPGWTKDAPSGDGRVQWSRNGVSGFCGAFGRPQP